MKIANSLCVMALLWSTASLFAVTEKGYSRFSRQRELMRKGEQYENLGRYKKAAKAYKKSGVYAIDNRTRATLLAREAECYAGAGRPYDAFAAYKRLLETYPLFVDYAKVMPSLRRLAGQFERGEGTMFGISNKTKAIEVYETILRETPLGKGVLQDSIDLGNLLVKADRELEAVDIYREALRRFPGDPKVPEIRLTLGRLLVNASRRGDGDGRIARQARRQLHAFIKAKPDDPARKDAEFLLRVLDERQADFLYGLGKFYLGSAHRREPAARRYLHDAVREYPKTAGAKQAELLLASLGPPSPKVEAAMALPPPSTTSEPSPPEKDVLPKPRVRKPAKPARRLLEGVFPGGAPNEGKARTFRPLKERENVQKWLVPLGDLNESSSGGTK